MSATLPRPATTDGLFLWVMHRFSEVFREHAILKGGMAMRLIDSPRSTTGLDYVFVPFASKKDIRSRIEEVLGEVEGGRVELSMHSKMLRAEIYVDSAAIQLEASVASECEGVPMSTGGFARDQGQPARIVRIMSPDWALAHKLSAWNERRLLRDLFDCYFFVARLGELPSEHVLDERLSEINSRLPRLRSRKNLSRRQLARELEGEAKSLDEKRINQELGGLLSPEDLAGLLPRIRAAISKLVDWLDRDSA